MKAKNTELSETKGDCVGRSKDAKEGTGKRTNDQHGFKGRTPAVKF